MYIDEELCKKCLDFQPSEFREGEQERAHK
jgi:hypothetical protein